LAGLSMRALAAELGTGVMSLYRYVEDREQLERVIVDLILSRVDLELDADASWNVNVVHLLERVRASAGAHPAIVPLLLTHRHLSGGSVRFGETLLSLLDQGGFSGQRRVIAFRTVMSFVLGALQYQHLGSLGGSGTAALAELPTSEYPLLAETARAAQALSPDTEFAVGLRAVLHGLSASLVSQASA
jgi:AcrR family transcriptional regulator